MERQLVIELASLKNIRSIHYELELLLFSAMSGFLKVQNKILFRVNGITYKQISL